MKIQKQFFFMSGLPRSGSTLLQSLLSQNPKIYGTPTSPLMDMLFFAEQAWKNTTQTYAHSDPRQLPNIYSGIINGIYEHIEKPIIIDKHRGWVKNIKGIKTCFPDAKCICTVRSVVDIISSFLILINKQIGETYLDIEMKQLKMPKTLANKCTYIWQKHLLETYESIKFGIENNSEHLIFIEYDDLIADPQRELNRIYDFLGLERYEHDFNNVQNKTPENDIHWGLIGLHDIRPKVEKTSPHPKEIIGMGNYKKFNNMNLEIWRNRQNFVLA